MATLRVKRPTVRLSNPEGNNSEDTSFLKEVGQGTARSYAGLASALTGQPLTPQGGFQKGLYGDTKTPLTAEESGRELVGDKAPFAVAAGLGLGLAALDLLPGAGTGAKRVLGTLSKTSKAAKAAKSYDEAIRVLTKGGVSREVIDTFNLGNKVVDATDDASIARVFNEAAQAEATFQKTGKVPNIKKVSRPTSEAVRASENVRRTTPSTKVPVEQVPPPKSITEVRRGLRDQALNKADEARFIKDEVLPDVPPKQRSESLKNLDTFSKETLGYTIDTVRVGDGAVLPKIENNFRNIAGDLGLNTDKPLKELVEDTVKLLDSDPNIGRQIIAPDDFYWTQSTIPGYLRNNRQAGFASLPDAFKKAKQTAAGRAVANRINKDVAISETIPPNTTAQRQGVQSAPDNVIEQARQRYNAVENIAQGTDSMARLAQKRAGMNAMDLASDLLTPISSRLGRINKSLKFGLRKMEIKTRLKTVRRLEKVQPMMEATKKMDPTDFAVFDLALKNGDAVAIEAVAKKYGIEKQIADARQVLDELFEEAKAVGLDVNYRDNFFPRQVKNPTAFSQYLRGRDDWGEIRKAIEDKAAKEGKTFTDLTDEEISGIVNNLLRGYGSKITLAQPGPLKARTIDEIGTDLNRFYENSNTAMLTYVHKITDEVEARRFFGKELGQDAVTKNPLTGEPAIFNADQSIGAYVTKLIADGKITASQQDEVMKILQARFKKGNMNGLISAYRDLEYISTMGNPISAITQIGDLAFSVYDNGFYNTLRGIGGTITRRNRLTKENTGIERVAQEFDNPAKTSKVLEKVFKMVGMEQIDRLGKESLMEARRLKLKQLAAKGDDELLTDLRYMFDEVDATRAMQELKEGAITERTKEVIINRLMDFQPIAKSEMPVKYLEMPNGRVLYMLKSFTIKQYDVFRREAIDKIVSGDKKQAAEGLRNLTYLAGVFMLANATADEIKDFVLGRETSLKDRTVDNVYRLFGASKFDVYNSRERGLGFAVMQRILPPASVIDRLSTDSSRIIEQKTYKTGPLEGQRYKSESAQSIPGGGKLYYWWFGRGAQKEKYSNRGGSGGAETNTGRGLSVSRPGQEKENNSRGLSVTRP